MSPTSANTDTFRFSLRTLVLFTMLAAAAIGLWKNRTPWEQYGSFEIVERDAEALDPPFEFAYMRVSPGVAGYRQGTHQEALSAPVYCRRLYDR